jgi:hypothetical protein
MESEKFKKFMKIYDSMADKESDIADRLATLLSAVNTWGRSVIESNIVNHRQGKLRSTYDSSKYELMKNSYEIDVDLMITERLDKLFISILNDYFLQKSHPSTSNKYGSASCLIMLFKNNQNSVLPEVYLPRYSVSWVEKVYETIDTMQEDILYTWMDYLYKTEPEHEALIDIVRSKGIEFFGDASVKVINTYEKNFGDFIGRLKYPEDTRKKYLELRARKLKISEGIDLSTLCSSFEISHTTYVRYKRQVISDFQDIIINKESNIQLLNRLVYGE